MKKPYLIDFPAFGIPETGYLSVAENMHYLPFVIKRVFWSYDIPENAIRGEHAHYQTEQILIALTGKIIVTTEQGNGEIEEFILDNPTQGVYLPPNVWHNMQYSESAVQIVLTSFPYHESDYIRSYEKFKEIYT